MHSAQFLLALGALAAASPFASPQDIDIDAIIAAGPPSSIIYATAPTVISVNPTSLASAAAAAVTASPLTVIPESSVLPSSVIPLDKRQASTTSNACATASPLPTGAGPVPTPDTASAFLGDASLAAIASAAPTPAGYVNSFTNLQAENQVYAYLGYSLLSSYDTVGCAKQCNSIYGCMAINVAFERAPSVDPEGDCDNPPSTTLIKCVFWGAPTTAQNALNTGQWRDNFQVVIAGSNGYVNNNFAAVGGYTGPTSLGNASINAPLDCNGDYTYMGYVSWNDGKPFDPSRCAAACTAQSNYNVAHPPSDGSAPMTCQFFNTYFLLKNDQVQAQVCAMYNETWNATYADNTGYYYGSDVYTIESSVSYSNTTSPGTCTLPPVNLVPNGDFSQGYNKYWTIAAHSGSYTVQSASTSYDGNGAAQLSCGDPFGDTGSVTYKNPIATVKGTKYTYSFRYQYVQGQNTGSTATVALLIPEPAVSLSAPSVNGWANSSGTFTATTTTSTIELFVNCPAQNQRVVIFDDVVVEVAS